MHEFNGDLPPVSSMKPEDHLAIARTAMMAVQSLPEGDLREQTPNLETATVGVMTQASRLIHDSSEQQKDGTPPQAVHVGEHAYDMWGFSPLRSKILHYMALWPGRAFRNGELQTAASTQRCSVVPALVNKIQANGSPESVFKNIMVVGGNAKRRTYSLVPQPGEGYDNLVSKQPSLQANLTLAHGALLHARASLAHTEVTELENVKAEALDVLSKTARMYRDLGMTAHRGNIIVILVDNEPYDLTGARPSNVDLLWFMADRVGQTLPMSVLAERFSSCDPDMLIQSIRDQSQPEHILHSRLLRDGSYRPRYGLSKSVNSPLAATKRDSVIYTPLYIRKQREPARHLTPHERKIIGNRLPIIPPPNMATPVALPPEEWLTSAVKTLPIEGEPIKVGHLSLLMQRVVSYLVANPERWFTDQELDICLGQHIGPDVLQERLNQLRSLVLYWQTHDSQPVDQPDTIEAYLDLARTPNRTKLIRLTNPQNVGRTAFEAAGLDWLIKDIDLRQKQFQVGETIVDISNIKRGHQIAAQVLLHNVGASLSSMQLRQAFLHLAPQSRPVEVKNFLKDIQDPSHVLFRLAHIWTPSNRRERLIWLASNDSSAETRFRSPYSQAPPQIKAPHSIMQTPQELLFDTILDPTLPLVISDDLAEDDVRHVLSRLTSHPALKQKEVAARFWQLSDRYETTKDFIKRLRTNQIHVPHPPEFNDLQHPNARCLDPQDRPNFFPRRGEPTLPAIELCLACAALHDCTAFALENHDRYFVGVWGGMGQISRNKIPAKIRKNRTKAIKAAEAQWVEQRVRVITKYKAEEKNNVNHNKSRRRRNNSG